VAARLDDAAWVAALLAVEVALVRRPPRTASVPQAHAEAVALAATRLELDPAELGRAAAEGWQSR
jgi:3-carboxy-cis,cis-muconate cycloisomerase